MSTKERVEEAMKRLGSQYKVAEELGLHQSTVSRHLAAARRSRSGGVGTAAGSKPTGAQRAHTGIEGFRALFDPAQRGHDAVQRLLDGELKERGWIYDTEMRSLAGIDATSWTNLRRDYNELLVEVKDPETRARKTVWCHPDIVKEARQVAKERAR